MTREFVIMPEFLTLEIILFEKLPLSIIVACALFFWPVIVISVLLLKKKSRV